MRFLMKSRFRRYLAFALIFVLMAGSMAAYSAKENTAEAASAVNSTKEFREKFVAECLARVGSGYESGGGYTNTASKVYDCTGLIGAAFTALGFKYGFGDQTSTNTWGYWGTAKWIEFANSLTVGEKVILYNTDNTQYLKFTVTAKNVDLVANPDDAEIPGTIILKPASGSSGAHATVSLGTFDDQGDPKKNVAYVQQQLINQYSSAVANSTYAYKHGATLTKILATNGTMYNNSNNTYGCANIWDWRQRNSATDFGANTSTQEYSKVWQVDALNTKMGVTVNNNGWGKAAVTTATMTLSFEEYGNCAFTKTDDSGHALMGATFGIYTSRSDAASGKNAVKTAASDSAGKVTFRDLVCDYDGTVYYIKEIAAPSGYVLSSTVYEVKIFPNQTASVNGGKISNTPWSGSVSLTKLETGTGTKLPGFTFTVYEWNGSSYAKLADLTDNGDGTYGYDGLKYSQTNKGKFRLKETATDGKHVLKEDWYQDFTLTKNGQTFAFELENERSEVDAYLCLYKQSDASAALSGVKFNVYDDADCKTLLQTITTDANGYAKSAAIPVTIGEERTVYVREMYQGGYYDGGHYLPDYTVYPVTLTEENTEDNPVRVGGTDYVIVNQRRLAYLELTKLRDDTDAPIGGVSFRVSQTAAMDAVIQTITTDANGYAKSAPINIPAEGYTVYVQEIPKDGYVPDDTVYAVKLYSDKVAVVNDGPIYNTPTKVEFSKTDFVTGKEIPDAKLRLWEVVQLGAMTARQMVTVTTEDGQTGTSWITTGEVTKIYAQLKAGATYVLEEIAAPAGYLIANEVEFTVNADGSITKVEMQDDCTKVVVRKVTK